MPERRRVKVESRKHDGSVRRSWDARLLRREGPLIVLDAQFAEEVRHPVLGTIEAGTLSRELFWTERWYSVFRFSDAAGALRCFYCNVNTPARLEGDTLWFVDLDVDVLVRADFSYSVLDEDEFESNAAAFDYPPEYRSRVDEAVAEIKRLVEARQFPFEGPGGE